MHKMPGLSMVLAVGLLGLAGSRDRARTDHTSVTGRVSVARTTEAGDSGDVAIWLKPIDDPGDRSALEAAALRVHPKILQRDKRFEPHVVVVPVGSVIDFPNADPFFHNVFSMFEGKRFDLGLYEAGTSRSVSFTTPGVCYIFCNIHPDMSAVVVVVDTPYYGISNRAGDFTLPNVPSGRYTLSVWHERDKPERPSDFPRTVTISAADPALGEIRLVESTDPIAPHKNKYGKDYLPPKPSSPIYK
jgi:plastocyanin